MTDAIPFKSRRTRLPVLILTHSMRQDAFALDRDRAALRRDMREVHRIEADARWATIRHLTRELQRTA